MVLRRREFIDQFLQEPWRGGDPASTMLSRIGYSPVDLGRSRRELKAAWRKRVDRARSRYEEKAAIRKKMVAERSVWPINREPDPDGRYALSVALQEESAARTEFMRLLTIHTELILHETPPEEQRGS
jgi:hypothetical protein